MSSAQLLLHMDAQVHSYAEFGPSPAHVFKKLCVHSQVLVYARYVSPLLIWACTRLAYGLACLQVNELLKEAVTLGTLRHPNVRAVCCSLRTMRVSFACLIRVFR